MCDSVNHSVLIQYHREFIIVERRGEQVVLGASVKFYHVIQYRCPRKHVI